MDPSPVDPTAMHMAATGVINGASLLLRHATSCLQQMQSMNVYFMKKICHGWDAVCVWKLLFAARHEALRGGALLRDPVMPARSGVHAPRQPVPPSVVQHAEPNPTSRNSSRRDINNGHSRRAARPCLPGRSAVTSCRPTGQGEGRSSDLPGTDLKCSER